MKYVIASLVMLCGCASSYDGVRQSLSNTASIVSSACSSFAQADRSLQDAIVHGASSKADAQKKIDTYRKGQSATVKACLDAQAGVAAATATLTAVESGSKNQTELAQATVTVWQLVQQLYQQLAAIGVVK